MFQYPDAGGVEPASFLGDLRADEVATILAQAQSRRYTAGDAAVSAGERDRSVFIVVDGAFEVSPRAGGGGQAATRALRRPGEIFGEVSFFDGLPQAADIVALEASEALVMTPAGFERLRLNEPRLAVLFLIDLGRMLTVRLRDMEKRRGSLGR